jgi:hypothetical protein
MGELYWKYLLHASNAIDTKVTECFLTDCNKQGIKKQTYKVKDDGEVDTVVERRLIGYSLDI